MSSSPGSAAPTSRRARTSGGTRGPGRAHMSDRDFPRHRRVRLHRRVGRARARRGRTSRSSPSTSRPTRAGCGSCSTRRGRGDPARRRRHHRPRRARARARRARDHERDPPRRAAGAVLPRRPAARRAGERARHRQRLRGRDGALDRMAPIVYASSIAAFDAPEDGGAAWRATRGRSTASSSAPTSRPPRVYHAENGVSSIGLRPHTVYGVGRDQGAHLGADDRDARRRGRRRRTRSPTAAPRQLQLARDVARAFIAASLSGARGRDGAQPARPERRIGDVDRGDREARPGAPARSASTTSRCRSPRRSTAARSTTSSPASRDAARRGRRARRSSASARSSPRALDRPSDLKDA